MTDIEKKASEYAEKCEEDLMYEIGKPCYDESDIEQAYLAGASYALGDQWHDMEKEGPEDGQECLCALRFTSHIEYCIMMFIANSKAWVKDHDDDRFTEHVIAWLPIPEYKPKGEC